METGRYSRLTQSPAVSSRLRSDYTAHLASHGEHEKSRQVGRVGVLIQIFCVTAGVHHILVRCTAAEPTDSLCRLQRTQSSHCP